MLKIDYLKVIAVNLMTSGADIACDAGNRYSQPFDVFGEVFGSEQYNASEVVVSVGGNEVTYSRKLYDFSNGDFCSTGLTDFAVTDTEAKNISNTQGIGDAGPDLNDVEAKTGDGSESAKCVKADAFASSSIVFSDGKPSNDLLAQELAHVVQLRDAKYENDCLPPLVLNDLCVSFGRIKTLVQDNDVIRKIEDCLNRTAFVNSDGPTITEQPNCELTKELQVSGKFGGNYHHQGCLDTITTYESYLKDNTGFIDRKAYRKAVFDLYDVYNGTDNGQCQSKDDNLSLADDLIRRVYINVCNGEGEGLEKKSLYNCFMSNGRNCADKEGEEGDEKQQVSKRRKDSKWVGIGFSGTCVECCQQVKDIYTLPQRIKANEAVIKALIDGKKREFCHFAQTYKCNRKELKNVLNLTVNTIDDKLEDTIDGDCDDTVDEQCQALSKDYAIQHVKHCVARAKYQEIAFTDVDPDFDCEINSVRTLVDNARKYNMTTFDYCSQGFKAAFIFNQSSIVGEDVKEEVQLRVINQSFSTLKPTNVLSRPKRFAWLEWSNDMISFLKGNETACSQYETNPKKYTTETGFFKAVATLVVVGAAVMVKAVVSIAQTTYYYTIVVPLREVKKGLNWLAVVLGLIKTEKDPNAPLVEKDDDENDESKKDK